MNRKPPAVRVTVLSRSPATLAAKGQEFRLRLDYDGRHVFASYVKERGRFSHARVLTDMRDEAAGVVLYEGWRAWAEECALPLKTKKDRWRAQFEHRQVEERTRKLCWLLTGSKTIDDGDNAFGFLLHADNGPALLLQGVRDPKPPPIFPPDYDHARHMRHLERMSLAADEVRSREREMEREGY